MKAIVWYSLMGFCVGVLILSLMGLFVVDRDNIMPLILNIAIYAIAVCRGWTKRRNWL